LCNNLNDINQFIKFWQKNNANNENLDNPLMRLRLEVFSKYDINFKVSNMHKYIHNFYKSLDKNNIIDIINKLQEEHKEKYFSEKPLLNKSSEFLEKYEMKEEWKFYDKKNKDVFF